MADLGITLRRHKRLAIITLGNPQNANAMTTEKFQRLTALLDEAAKSDAVATIVTGTGKFFSAGADVKQTRPEFERGFYMARFAQGNADLARALYEHPKVLIAALNGPAIGLSAAILGYFDFIYASTSAYLLTPFTRLGLVAEGGASQTFAQRLGPRAAREALIFSKKLDAQALFDCGFVSKVFPLDNFHDAVTAHVEDELSGLDESAIIHMKRMVRDGENPNGFHAANLNEILAGTERFATGIPQRQFAAIASGQLRHKLYLHPEPRISASPSHQSLTSQPTPEAQLARYAPFKPSKAESFFSPTWKIIKPLVETRPPAEPPVEHPEPQETASMPPVEHASPALSHISTRESIDLSVPRHAGARAPVRPRPAAAPKPTQHAPVARAPKSSPPPTKQSTPTSEEENRARQAALQQQYAAMKAQAQEEARREVAEKDKPKNDSKKEEKSPGQIKAEHELAAAKEREAKMRAEKEEADKRRHEELKKAASAPMPPPPPPKPMLPPGSSGPSGYGGMSSMMGGYGGMGGMMGMGRMGMMGGLGGMGMGGYGMGMRGGSSLNRFAHAAGMGAQMYPQPAPAPAPAPAPIVRQAEPPPRPQPAPAIPPQIEALLKQRAEAEKKAQEAKEKAKKDKARRRRQREDDSDASDQDETPPPPIRPQQKPQPPPSEHDGPPPAQTIGQPPHGAPPTRPPQRRGSDAHSTASRSSAAETAGVPAPAHPASPRMQASASAPRNIHRASTDSVRPSVSSTPRTMASSPLGDIWTNGNYGSPRSSYFANTPPAHKKVEPIFDTPKPAQWRPVPLPTSPEPEIAPLLPIFTPERDEQHLERVIADADRKIERMRCVACSCRLDAPSLADVREERERQQRPESAVEQAREHHYEQPAPTHQPTPHEYGLTDQYQLLNEVERSLSLLQHAEAIQDEAARAQAYQHAVDTLNAQTIAAEQQMYANQQVQQMPRQIDWQPQPLEPANPYASGTAMMPYEPHPIAYAPRSHYGYSLTPIPGSRETSRPPSRNRFYQQDDYRFPGDEYTTEDYLRPEYDGRGPPSARTRDEMYQQSAWGYF